MIVRRRCVKCLCFFDVDEHDKNTQCPKCRAKPKTEKDDKTRLKELCEAKRWTLDYPEIARTGPDHAPTYTVECRINGKLFGTGSGPGVKAATRAAATEALRKLNT